MYKASFECKDMLMKLVIVVSVVSCSQAVGEGEGGGAGEWVNVFLSEQTETKKNEEE